MPYHHDAFQTGGSDGRFFHYALAKLGSSAAQLYTHKKGRAMCEAFGAYGWNEGLKTMKWIADHLIVRGINYIVPHAFSPKEYPDFDCPPHFYARGNNPQFRYMPYLTDYINRLQTIFSGGEQVAPVALFYQAEFEWVGKAMPIEVPAEILTRAQIDFNIVPADLLKEAQVTDGHLIINGHKFKALVLPQTECLPVAIRTILENLKNQGLEIIFLENHLANVGPILETCTALPTIELPCYLAKYRELKLQNIFKDLVYYHYRKNDKDYWMFYNESLSQIVDTNISFTDQTGQPKAYDAYNNQYNEVVDNHLYLEPYQTIVWIFDGTQEPVRKKRFDSQRVTKSLSWQVEFAPAQNYPTFTPVINLDKIVSLDKIEGYDRSSGTVAYSTVLSLKSEESYKGIDLGKAYEIAEVFVNGQSAGVNIAPPYRYDIEALIRQGDNDIRIEVTNTLGTKFRGGINQYLIIEPFGLVDDITFY